MLDLINNGRGHTLDRYRTAQNSKEILFNSFASGLLPNLEGKFPDGFLQFQLSGRTIREIRSATNKLKYMELSDGDANDVINFVETLHGVSLSNTKINYFYDGHDHDIEGFCITCGQDEHEVFIPQPMYSAQDLLAHELGHAAHAIIKRKNDDCAYWLHNPLMSEMIAYFTQFSYLLENGSRDDFMAALGAVLDPYFALLLLGKRLPSFEEFIACNEMYGIREAYSRAELFDLYTKHHDVNGFLKTVYPRMGLMLAIKLLGNGVAIKSIIAIDRVDISPEEKLKKILSNYDEIVDFSSIDECIDDLVVKNF